jgi:hypothetical protein
LDAAVAASEGGLHGCFFGENMAVVMVWFLGHLGDEERTSRDLGGCGVSATTSPKSCSEDQTQVQQVFQFVGVREDFSGQKPRVLTPMAAMPTSVVTLFGAQLWVPFVEGLRVKTLDHWSRWRHSASLPSWGRCRGVLFPSVITQCHRWQVLVFLVLCCLSMICFVRGFPHYLISVWPNVALFIKHGESLFRKIIA